MKKYFILLCAALLSFAACNKVVVEEQPVIDNNDVVLTFTSERPQLDADTKTAWDTETSSIVWSEGDKIRVGYTLGGEWMGKDATGDAKFYSSTEVAIDESNASVGTFNVPISDSAFSDPATEGKYMFYAIYPASLLTNTTVADAPDATVTLKTIQNPTADSFEGSTDIMVGKTAEIELEGLPTDPIELVWDRVVAHGYFTLKDLQGVEAGETITKVTLTAQDGAALAGEFTVSLEDGSFTASNATNEVVINGTELTFVEESGMTNLKIWLSVLPETLTSLKVDLATNKANYVREITGISKTLKRNARNVLAINMASATRTEVEEVQWVKKDISAITSSDVFVIVGNNGSNFAMTNDNGTGSAPTASPISVSDNKLVSNPVDNIQWTLSNSTDGYTFYPNGTTETWLYCTSSNNGVRVGTNNAKTFTIDGGYLKHSGTSRYVGVYNSTDWRCYTTNGGNIENQTIAFYVKTVAGPTKPVPTITFGEPTTEVNIGESVTNAATIDPETLSMTYASSSTSVATVDANGKVTGVAAGTATITASFAGDDTYDSASASYEITVVDPDANDGSAEKPYTASEAAALALGGSTASNMHVKGIISSIAVPYNSSNNTVSFYISDDGLTSSSQFEIYKASATSENDYNVGDAVIFKGTFTKYNSTPEFEAGSTMISQLHAPSFTPDGGSFTTDTQSITLTADAGAEIRYTTDGNTAPTVSVGTVYSAPISISVTTIIKAIAVKDGLVTGVISKTFTKSSGGEEVTLQYTGTTTGNFGTGNEAATVGLSAEDWSVIGDQGEASNNVGFNKAGDIRLYWNAEGSNILTVSSLKDATINFITIEYTGDSYSNGKVLVGGNAVSISNGSYPINSSSFAITNGNTSNVQVRIKSIVINYTPSN